MAETLAPKPNILGVIEKFDSIDAAMAQAICMSAGGGWIDVPFEDWPKFINEAKAARKAYETHAADAPAAMSWQPIETAPKDKRFIAAIWHGSGYVVCQAERIGKFVSDTEEGSCVTWRPGLNKPVPMWQPLPSPPLPTNRETLSASAEGGDGKLPIST